MQYKTRKTTQYKHCKVYILILPCINTNTAQYKNFTTYFTYYLYYTVPGFNYEDLDPVQRPHQVEEQL